MRNLQPNLLDIPTVVVANAVQRDVEYPAELLSLIAQRNSFTMTVSGTGILVIIITVPVRRPGVYLDNVGTGITMTYTGISRHMA